MTENPKKPEWFELTDGDAPSAQVTKVNKKLPLAAVLITGAVIATGAFFANASESDANAEQSVLAQTIPSTSAGSSAATSTTSSSPSTSQSTSNPAQSPAIQNPNQGGVPAPVMGGGDDDGDHERGEGRERGGDHEGREHEGREGHEDRD